MKIDKPAPAPAPVGHADFATAMANVPRRTYIEFDVPPGMGLNANTLKTLLNGQEDGLQEAVDALVSELALVKQDAGLKRWLNQQRKLSQRLG